MPTFMVLAHAQPELVARLVKKLSPDPVLVHVDRRSPHSAFRRALSALDNVTMISSSDSVSVKWATYSVAEAMLVLLREAVTSTADDDHVVFLSGQDYPLRPLAEFRAHLAQAPFRQHTRLIDPYTAGAESVDFFVKKHYFVKKRYFVKKQKPDQDLAIFPSVRQWSFSDRMYFRAHGAVQRTLGGLGTRKLPANWRFAFGSQWMALTGDCGKFVLEAIEPWMVRYFRRVWAPDERFIQSIIANSKYLAETPAGKLEGWLQGSWPENFHHIDPELNKTFNINDLHTLDRSKQFFVRKVSSPWSDSLLDQLDRREDPGTSRTGDCR